MTIHTYTVKSWGWTQELADDFGPNLTKLFGPDLHPQHELSDSQVIAAIIKHGRAEIKEAQPAVEFVTDAQPRILEFQNDYD